MQREMDTRLAETPHPSDIGLACDWNFVGEAYHIDPEAPIVRALRKAHEMQTGNRMELGAVSAIVDASRLVAFAKTPAILCGCGQSAHADHEYVMLDRLRDDCRLALRTAINYLDGEA